jgi:hypothetical protein
MVSQFFNAYEEVWQRGCFHCCSSQFSIPNSASSPYVSVAFLHVLSFYDHYILSSSTYFCVSRYLCLPLSVSFSTLVYVCSYEYVSAFKFISLSACFSVSACPYINVIFLVYLRLYVLSVFVSL